MGKFPKLLPYLAVFALGVAVPAAWKAVFPANPVDRLLLPQDARVEVLPHMSIPSALRSGPAPDEFTMDTTYRLTLRWNAVTELYGPYAHSGGDDRQFVDGPAAEMRHRLTRLQIQETKPAFLPQYEALYAALVELDGVLCEMRVADSGTSAFEAYPNLAPGAELLARLAHYQMAKGGRGGDAELDVPAFDRSIAAESRSSFEGRRRDYPARRVRLIALIRRIDGLLADWDPACAKLLVEHINERTDAFRR